MNEKDKRCTEDDPNKYIFLLEKNGITFDYAVPQPWLDDIVRKAQVKYDLYFVWAYPPSASGFGLPCPRGEEGLKILKRLNIPYYLPRNTKKEK